jgi:hypothetical protein
VSPFPSRAAILYQGFDDLKSHLKAMAIL